MNEELVVHYINECSLELHLHGGETVLAVVESTICGDGAKRIDWREYRENLDSRNRERAAVLLGDAKTEKTARILLDQYSGALERTLAEIESLQNVDSTAADSKQERLRQTVRYGEKVIYGFTVAILGPVNAGKSSLLNAILGFERMIVDSTPGTTRDLVEVETVLDGWPFRFFDSAGIRETCNKLENIGMELALSTLDTADLILWIADLSRSHEPFYFEAKEKSTNFLTVYNKCDLPISDRKLDPPEDAVLISARENIGIETLLCAISQILLPDPPQPGEGVFLKSEG